MNIYKFLDRGPHGTTLLQQRDNDSRMAAIATAAEGSRAHWLRALLADQTRTWLNIGEVDRDALANNSIMLTIAGFCHVFDGGSEAIESPTMRIIRGAISAATQAVQAGGVLTVDDARAFSAAAERAAVVIQSATIPAIVHAAESIRRTVGLADGFVQSQSAEVSL